MRNYTITVDRSALLKLVRHIDVGEPLPVREFAAAFDQIRCAFEPEEIASGKIRTAPDNHPST